MLEISAGDNKVSGTCGAAMSTLLASPMSPHRKLGLYSRKSGNR